MNKIINDLLNTNARVIIPDFGAFIIKQKTPRLIVFNEFLRYNDGLLTDYISASEGINKDIAKGKVANYVEDINKRLNAGEEILFEGIGKLIKESSGKLTLNEITSSDVPGQKKEKKAAASKQSKEEIVKPDKEKDIAEPVAKSVKKEEGEATKTVIDKKEDKTEDVKPQPEPEISKTEIELSIEKEEIKPSPSGEKLSPQIEKVTVTPIKTSVEKETSVKPRTEVKPVTGSPQKTGSKRNTLQIIIWILLIVIVNGFIIVWFVFNDKITDLFSKGKKQATEEVIQTLEPNEAVVDETTEEVTPVELPAEEAISQPVIQSAREQKSTPSVIPAASDRKQYYIVAGCFRDEGNADKLVQELRQNGFNARKFGMIGNLHAVSFNAFSDKSDALVELKNIRNSGNPEAWIVFY